MGVCAHRFRFSVRFHWSLEDRRPRAGAYLFISIQIRLQKPCRREYFFLFYNFRILIPNPLFRWVILHTKYHHHWIDNFPMATGSGGRAVRRQRRLLVAEAVLLAAVGALPGDAVARHAPDILVHAGLTDVEAAAAGPAEGLGAAAAVAGIGAPPVTTAVGFFGARICGHGAFFLFSRSLERMGLKWYHGAISHGRTCVPEGAAPHRTPVFKAGER